MRRGGGEGDEAVGLLIGGGDRGRTRESAGQIGDAQHRFLLFAVTLLRGHGLRAGLVI